MINGCILERKCSKINVLTIGPWRRLDHSARSTSYQVLHWYWWWCRSQHYYTIWNDACHKVCIVEILDQLLNAVTLFWFILNSFLSFWFHVIRCLGVVLLHPTANASTMMETFKDRFSKWQIKQVNASAENIVAFRKFGHKVNQTIDYLLNFDFPFW